MLAAAPPQQRLPDQTDEMRAIARRASARRLAMQSDNAQLRLRYGEILRWINPPWDANDRRIQPRIESATAERLGEGKFHYDQVGQAVLRWASLEMGTPVICRVEPRFVPTPLPEEDPTKRWQAQMNYQIDHAQAALQTDQMEALTEEWATWAEADQTFLWAAWSKRAFGKAILRTGWDPIGKHPTLELLENPSQVSYGWSSRYGKRRLAWVDIAEQIGVDEANRRYDLGIPVNSQTGAIEWSSWTGMDVAEFDQRAEQIAELQQMVWAEEYWELELGEVIEAEEGAGERQVKPALVRNAFIVGNRVVDGPHEFDWMRRIPIEVVENEHIPTYLHSKSTAEQLIPTNAAYDDMIDRQHEVIAFESGPRYMGINMFNSIDQVDVPKPFQMVGLREGEMIQQIDTKVDFFPTQLHAGMLEDATYKGTGLTPIAWGLSRYSQTSGRAMAAEWQAVELPLTWAITATWKPAVRNIWSDWWDFAEHYESLYAGIAHGYRRFAPKFQPLDIRDTTEKALSLLQLLQAHIIDPETVLEALAFENGDEIMARVRLWLSDPVLNPVAYQQMLALQQLSINIQMQALQLQQAQAQAQQQAQQSGQQQVALQAAQAAGPGAPLPPPGVGTPASTGTSVAQNQPGQTPNGGGLPFDMTMLSRTPFEGGLRDQVQLQLQGGPGGGAPPPPPAGQPVPQA